MGRTRKKAAHAARGIPSQSRRGATANMLDAAAKRESIATTRPVKKGFAGSAGSIAIAA